MEDNALTSKTYWEDYYKANHAQKKHIINVCSYYDAFWQILFKDNTKDKTLIEIGGFPGRYLAYLAWKHKISPTCLDYNSNVSQVIAAFKTMEVEDFTIVQEDFLKYQTNKQYDYVFSNGFIEHFEDYNSILDLHVNYIKPGGRLMVMVPNKRYLRQLYGYLFDYKNLKAHNLNCMKLSVFKDFAKRHHLHINTLQYYGGFPFSVHQKLNGFQTLIYKVTRMLFKKILNPILIKHPTKYMSATIIAIFEKPLNQ